MEKITTKQNISHKENIAKPEKPLSRQEIIEKEYAQVINLCEEQYDKNIEQNPDAKPMRSGLNVHNNIVLGYANKLIEAGKNLTLEQKVATTIATILHDSGKLNSNLLEHHIQGAKYAEEIMDKMMGQTIEGVEITENIRQKVKEAIERHMNHPYLIMQNNNKRFSEPQDNVDKMVFDADMMANVGFKNVAFRFIDAKCMEEDSKVAKKQNTTTLQASFENVMHGVRDLEGVVLAKEATNKIEDLINQANKIFTYLQGNEILQKIQGEFSDHEEFNKDTIEQHGGLPIIKKRLNEEIVKAGAELKIDKNIIKNFLM